MKLSRITEIRGDETAGYSVELSRKYTVREFVKKVVSNEKDWGYIGIKSKGSFFGNPNCEYKWGKLLSDLPESLKDEVIEKVEANGGWSRMDYLLELASDSAQL